MQIRPYQGTPDRPFPAAPPGWREVLVPYSDEPRRARASGLLGQLPAWSFVDEPDARGTGVTRYFAFDHAMGRGVGAIWLEPEDGGTLGQTNPSFAVPTAAQLAAQPPGQPLLDAMTTLINDFDTNGVPPETTQAAAVGAFQTAYNADPLSQLVPAPNGTLNTDQEYGPNTQAALNLISGGIAPPVNGGGAVTPTTPGQTTPEPVPVVDATCAQWTADATNPQANAMATSIAYQNSPAVWTDQGTYDATIGGVRYRFVMWFENGLKAVASYRCGGAAVATAGATSSGGTVAAVVLGTLVVGGLIVTAVAAKHPLRF